MVTNANPHLVLLTSPLRGKARKGQELSPPTPIRPTVESPLARAEQPNAKPLDFEYGARVGTGQTLKGPMYPEDRAYFDMFISKLQKEVKARQLRPGSLDHYRSATHQFLSWTYEYERGPVTGLCRQDVDDWTLILAGGDDEHSPALEPHAEAYVLNRFKGAFIFFGWLEMKLENTHPDWRNPFARARRPQVTPKAKPVASMEQLEGLRESLENRYDRRGKKREPNWRDLAITGFFYDTGLRSSELRNLLDASIDQELVLGAYRIFVDGDNIGTKNHKDRKVRVTPETMFYYREYRRTAKLAEPKYAFNGPKGQLAERSMGAIVRRAWRASGQGVVLGPHAFRHSLATDIVKKHLMDDRALMDYMGWGSMAMVLNYTRSLSPDRAADAASLANIGYGQVEGRSRRRRARGTSKDD